MATVREAVLPWEFEECAGPHQVAEYWRQAIAAAPGFLADRESLYALHLNTQRRVTGHHLVSVGILNETLCHAREVFRTAIAANAHSVVLVHNHPSGNPVPSPHDIRGTERIRRAGRLIGIEVADHVVVAMNRGGFVQACSVFQMLRSATPRGGPPWRRREFSRILTKRKRVQR